MHAIKGSWAGQAFALATSNDSSGRKSRIRRSKEERKGMVESFIKKYQKSNNGNFPSLNLTHKEVGGSFYTVREIVREIIQENRVLAPPQVSSEELGSLEFLEQYPLGSISMEPQIDFSISDNVHMVTHVLPPKDQISSEENISSSSEQLNEKIVVNGIDVLEENSHFDKPAITNIDHQENNDGNALLSSQTSQRLTNEHDQTVDKNKEFGERIYTKSAVTEILDKEKYGAQDLEASQTAKSRVSSNVVVETFPLRPLPRTIHDMDGESGNLEETDGTFEAIRSSSGFANAKGEERLTDEKVVLNFQGSSLESSKYSSASESIVLDIGDIKDLESEDSLPVGTKASSITVKRKASGQDNSSLPKESNPTLDRINLETWELTSKKSTRPESNPLLALVKAFVSSFVKFWT